MNRQQRRRQQKEIRQQFGNGHVEKFVRELPAIDFLKFHKEYMGFEKYSTENAVRNGVQLSFSQAKDISPRIELSDEMFDSYFLSFCEHCESYEDALRMSIPPYEHGILRILGLDNLWREWWVSNVSENAFDLRIDTYILSDDLLRTEIRDKRFSKMLKDYPSYFLRTFSLYTHSFIDNDGRKYTYNLEKCLTYNDLVDGMFQAEANKYEEGSWERDRLQKLYEYAKKNVIVSAETINEMSNQIEEIFVNAIIAFNYAASLNTCERYETNDVSHKYIYEFNTSTDSLLTEQKQLSLAAENRNVIRVKSSSPDLMSSDNKIVRHLNPIIWTRRGHLRHYKNGKVSYVKPAECHWQQFEESQLTRKQSVVRLTDIFLETSSLERYTSNYLDEKNIDYIPQYSFPDLTGDGNVLRFDFAIKKDDKILALIECQGEQHYHPVNIWGGEKQFEKQQRYDLLKVDYADKHEYPLLLMDGRKIKTESDVYDFLDKNLNVFI